MSKLNIDQKTVLALFNDKRTDFLIPDYQRPYAWGEKECQTLWDDLFSFAFPDNNYENFDRDNDEYFLGPIVTFKNENNKMEIIDGQQRLTTLLLLLRAFYEKYGYMKDKASVKTQREIEECLWKSSEDGTPDKTKLKIDSEVATDREKEEFNHILKNGSPNANSNNRYAHNYRFFQEKIREFQERFSSWFSYFPLRIMEHCVLLPIEAESQDTALRIFSTLNDRGKPLSDADIFKAQFYKYYSANGKKDYFIESWKKLEVLCRGLFPPVSGSSMDELFIRYMYYERALLGNKSSTTEALRKFYERNNYDLLKHEETFENLIDLANFWNDVQNQNVDRFSDDILRLLFILNYAPNGMWTDAVSVYYMQNRKNEGKLEEYPFLCFLNKIIGFIWAYALTNPGVNALRTPMFAAMVDIVNNHPVEFSDYVFNVQQLKNLLQNYQFSNNRAITKSMLTWWAFQNPTQELLPLETILEIEHIYARNRQDKEQKLSNPENVEKLGNKSLLEKKINIRASDYKFADKKKYYTGYENARKQKKDGTKIKELVDLSNTAVDFTEEDIISRQTRIENEFINFLRKNRLIKEN